MKFVTEAPWGFSGAEVRQEVRAAIPDREGGYLRRVILEEDSGRRYTYEIKKATLFARGPENATVAGPRPEQLIWTYELRFQATADPQEVVELRSRTGPPR